MKRFELGEQVATTSTGASNQMVTPFLEGMSVVADITMNGYSGTPKIQGSDDGTTWSDLLAPGAMTTQTRSIRKEIVCKRYMRHDTTRSAGDVTYSLENNL